MTVPRNLVVCCDGTGNFWTHGETQTNVVKLMRSLVKDRDRQLYYYDPGVGTPDGLITEETGIGLRAKWNRLLGLALGGGVWQNVGQAYAFLVNAYRAGDRIFLFGFSRGAFTARAVSGLVARAGLLQPDLPALLPTLIGVYRSAAGKKRDDAFGGLRERFCRDPVPVHFIGVWDTVESVGIRGVALGGVTITSDTTVSPRLHHVRHALALDELRWAYTPRLYSTQNLPSGADHSFKQVWFAGAHCDVGGGYRERGLANESLHWMAREAASKGLLVNFDKLDGDNAANPLDRLHDETASVPLWTITGAFRRPYPAAGFCVHESVDRRKNTVACAYAPQIPDAPAVAATLTSWRDDAGGEVVRVVNRAYVQAAPAREPLAPWLWPALVVSAIALFFYLRRFGTAGLELAFWQSTAIFSGVSAKDIAELGGMRAVGVLLGWDCAAILVYTVFIVCFMRIVLPLTGPAGYPDPGAGKWLSVSGGWLPVADLLENLLTPLVLGIAALRDVVPFAYAGSCIAATLMFMASLAKLLLLAAFLIGSARALVLAIGHAFSAPRTASP